MKVTAVLQSIGNYFVTTNAPAVSTMVQIGLVISIVLLVVSWVGPWVLSLLKKKHKMAWLNQWWSFVTLVRYASLVWLVLFFLRYEAIAPFGFRLWNYIVLLIVLVIGYTLLRGIQRTKPLHERQSAVEERYAKYLPKARQK